MLVSKMPSLTCVHTLYNISTIRTKACCQNTQSYMFTYPLLQHIHKKYQIAKFPVLYAYIPYTPKKTPDAKIPSLIYVHTLYTNIDINKNACFQNDKSYMFTYPLNQHRHKQKAICQYAQSYMCTYPIQQYKHKYKHLFPK